MPLVKKVDPEWFPTESPYLQVGEVIEISQPRYLIEQGKVVVAETPAETRIEPQFTGQFVCKSCGFTAKNALGLLSHQRRHK